MTEINKTPKEIVSELDQYIIGQDEAKRSVAIALRNRYRRMQLEETMQQEVNIAYFCELSCFDFNERRLDDSRQTSSNLRFPYTCGFKESLSPNAVRRNDAAGSNTQKYFNDRTHRCRENGDCSTFGANFKACEYTFEYCSFSTIVIAFSTRSRTIDSTSRPT
jgi:hypothetical protein